MKKRKGLVRFWSAVNPFFCFVYCIFNPRTLMRDATQAEVRCQSGYPILIHAPLCGMRYVDTIFSTVISKISIHAPLCGMRWSNGCGDRFLDPFQSTHPCARCDRVLLLSACRFHHFNPRTPMRDATKDTETDHVRRVI